MCSTPTRSEWEGAHCPAPQVLLVSEKNSSCGATSPSLRYRKFRSIIISWHCGCARVCFGSQLCCAPRDCTVNPPSAGRQQSASCILSSAQSRELTNSARWSPLGWLTGVTLKASSPTGGVLGLGGRRRLECRVHPCLQLLSPVWQLSGGQTSYTTSQGPRSLRPERRESRVPFTNLASDVTRVHFCCLLSLGREPRSRGAEREPPR